MTSGKSIMSLADYPYFNGEKVKVKKPVWKINTTASKAASSRAEGAAKSVPPNNKKNQKQTQNPIPSALSNNKRNQKQTQNPISKALLNNNKNQKQTQEPIPKALSNNNKNQKQIQEPIPIPKVQLKKPPETPLKPYFIVPVNRSSKKFVIHRY